ncbi:MAG: carbamoyl-phosphate synthase large subunit [Phycisphaerales bacterium]|nr:carbamoyl-phosphate synthase large subunit [Phycisphaerales bacterium]
MPKRTDIRTILVLGSGPIVIGQGCEFDYSGTQACKALKAEGYRIVLVNSNPATIMTDPAFSDRTYIEPITPESVRKIIRKESELGPRIDAILPTLGGQTALNCACALWDNGTLTEFGIQMIGASREVIHRAEDRQIFKEICEKIGLRMPRAKTVQTIDEGLAFLEEIGLPAVLRPAFTLGGTGGGIAYNKEEFKDLLQRGLAASMIGQVQIDQSVIGWKEFELEVVRDKKDNCIIVCGIENIDPMGVHTGDSITVAPILTLTDKEYQAMRDAAIAIMRAVGVETGGSNVQFAVNPDPKPDPKTGKKPFEMVVVEMNPRVSRSSALASKATGFPIAKIAAKLAIGYTLDELKNDITGTTSACFEPTIDYIVTKMPRWTFEKFPEADETLTTQMKSVGEAMAIGRTFKESLQKVIRSMDVKRFGLGLDRNDKWLAAMRAIERDQLLLDVTPGTGSPTGLRTADGAPIEWPIPLDKLTRKLAVPSQGRLYYIRYALKMGWSIEKIQSISRIDPFFLDQVAQLVEFEEVLCSFKKLEDLPADTFFRAKQLGYSDAQLANLYLGNISPATILTVRRRRQQLAIEPVYKLVDTCAAEFEAITPYYYSTYERGSGQSGIGHPATGIRDDAGRMPNAESRMPSDSDEIRISPTPKVIILGGGPNRIGQGIEFDYCCCHAAFAARDLGFESVMINSNPETVSTDYDTSDLLFFEPLTLEDTLNVIERLNGGPLAKPGLVHGVIVQFGGQTPLNLAKGLVAAGVPIIGTSLDSIDLAEDRDRFDALLERLKLERPPSGIAKSIEEAVIIAGRLGYPVLLRPSYVLGGRGMEICPDETALRSFITTALRSSDLEGAPVLIDKFLDSATEVDVDVVADYRGAAGQVAIAGVMEHIEHAGVHSGDSACTIPPWSLSPELVTRIEEISKVLARELKVCGLMNLQLAIKNDGATDRIYILEVNPRASRTVPFVSKAKHIPWPNIAARAMMGRSLAELSRAFPAMADQLSDTPRRSAAPEKPRCYAVKESVFPFSKFPGVDVVLGPEMRSTGEVMGIDPSLPIAFAKSQIAAGITLPTDPAKGGVFLSVRSIDRHEIIAPARKLLEMGFTVYTTEGTGQFLEGHGLRPKVLQKIGAGARPNVLDLMQNGQISLIINTPTRTGWNTDEGKIRSTAVRLGIPMITTATAANAVVKAMEALRAGDWGVAALQDYEAKPAARHGTVAEVVMPAPAARAR